MKKLIIITVALALLLGFSACSKDNEPTATSETASTAAATQKQNTTAAPTTAVTTESTTTKQAADISALYKGYWYQNDGNKVIVLQFQKSGSVTVSAYRRKTIASDTKEPDSVSYGNFKDNGNGTVTVCLDNENPEETYVYTLDANGALSYTADDPEGGQTVQVQNFDVLSRETARKVLFDNN